MFRCSGWFMFFLVVLVSLLGHSLAMSARYIPDVQGVCTHNLTAKGHAAGFVTIRTASEENPGASARFRSGGWSPWPRYSGSVRDVYHYENSSTAIVSVGINFGTRWIPYYAYTNVYRYCDD